MIVLNSANPASDASHALALALEEKYGAPVALVNALEISEEDFEGIMELLLGQFSIKEIKFNLPKYLSSLENDHWLRSSIVGSIRNSLEGVSKIDDISECVKEISKNEYVSGVPEFISNLGTGEIDVSIDLRDDLYYKIISELCEVEISDDEELFRCIATLSSAKKELDKFTAAIDEVNSKGYGIVLPDVDDMTLEEPEIVKQAGAYGVKLRASAPSIHMIRAQIETEINPIVGTQEQSQEIIKYMLEEFEDEPKKIWESNMFGKSLYELVNEGLHAKLEHISEDSRTRLSDTLSRIINEGSGGLICIIL